MSEDWETLEWARQHLARMEAAEEARTKARRDELAEQVASRRVRVERAFTDMLEAMREASDAGVTVAEICAKAGISRQTFYKWVKRGDAPATPFAARGPRKEQGNECEEDYGF